MRKRILVIDDDQALRSLIQELLEEEAYEVETAIDGLPGRPRPSGPPTQRV